jgi:hypothetical protein
MSIMLITSMPHFPTFPTPRFSRSPHYCGRPAWQVSAWSPAAAAAAAAAALGPAGRVPKEAKADEAARLAAARQPGRVSGNAAGGAARGDGSEAECLGGEGGTAGPDRPNGDGEAGVEVANAAAADGRVRGLLPEVGLARWDGGASRCRGPL